MITVSVRSVPLNCPSLQMRTKTHKQTSKVYSGVTFIKCARTRTHTLKCVLNKCLWTLVSTPRKLLKRLYLTTYWFFWICRLRFKTALLLFRVHQISQEVPAIPASASPEKCWEMQILGHHPRSIKSEPVRVRLGEPYWNQPSRQFLPTLG